MIKIPDSVKVTGIQAQYKVSNEVNYSYSFSNILFNGSASSGDRCLIYDNYGFDLTVYETVNIGFYASPYSGSGELKLTNLDTKKIYTLGTKTGNSWNWFWHVYEQLPAGTYRVRGTGTYYASEVYVESLTGYMYLINSSNLMYNVKDTNYDTKNKKYLPISHNSDIETTNQFFNKNRLEFSELFEDKIINEEEFKPINKFNNFTILRLKGLILKQEE